MARLPRLFVPGLPQLITQRGNNRSTLFRDDADFAQFLAWLRLGVHEERVQLHAYVLMPDHFHLLLTAPTSEATARALQKLGRRFVRWHNDRHARTGTLWEGRFRSAVVAGDDWTLHCYRYIELNPVRAQLVAEARYWPWSSARVHLGLEADPHLVDHASFWSLGNTPFERQAAYRKQLDSGTGASELVALRRAAHSGWVLGELPPDVVPSRRAARLPKGRPPASSAG